MKGLILGFLRALRLSVKLLKGLVRKRKRKSKRGRKIKAYVYNFSVGRVKNVSYQRNMGRNRRKKANLARKLIIQRVSFQIIRECGKPHSFLD